MRVRYKHDIYNRVGAMAVGGAVIHALRADNPVAKLEKTEEMLARLIDTMSKKGLLIPSEVITVLGSNYEQA